MLKTHQNKKKTQNIRKTVVISITTKKSQTKLYKRYHPREKCKNNPSIERANVDLLFGCVLNCTAIIKDSHKNDLGQNNLMHWLSVL